MPVTQNMSTSGTLRCLLYTSQRTIGIVRCGEAFVVEEYGREPSLRCCIHLSREIRIHRAGINRVLAEEDGGIGIHGSVQFRCYLINPRCMLSMTSESKMCNCLLWFTKLSTLLFNWAKVELAQSSLQNNRS